MLVLFGGSFDPVHIGHVIIAREVKETLGVNKVIFVPAYKAPLKETHSATPQDRLNMLKLAVEREPYFEIEDCEVKRGGISYTVDTLKYILPKIKKKPFFLIGADSVLKLHLWKDPLKVLELSRLAIVDREGKIKEVRNYLREHFPYVKEGEEVLFLPIRRIDISATEIRKRVKEGKSIYCMVPEKVELYIKEKGLYR